MRELIVDGFAGGGGASEGITLALGRGPDLAYNHDAEALAMHRMNHPETRHVRANIMQVDPLQEVGNRRIGLAWFSPDCKHHSKAKGGKPVKRAIRDLAWVVVLWAKRARPRVILLENVEEFADWGPLVEREPGKFYPCPERRGQTFERWVGELRRLGYRVEWRELRACDYGAPTIRKRLFLIARRDGRPIVWPAPTHAPLHVNSDGLVTAWTKGHGLTSADLQGMRPQRTAASIIDWSQPCHSIFLTREDGRAAGVNRPLAENTMARIAKGVKRYVLDAAAPFIVSLNHGDSGGRREYGVDEVMRTLTGSRGEAIVTPFVAHHRTGHVGASAEVPLCTVTANGFEVRPGGAAPIGIVAPILTHAQQGGRSRSAGEPLHTVTASSKDQNQVAAVMLSRQFGASVGSDATEPVGTVTAGGGGKTALVAAFLAQHNTDMVGHAATEPVSTIVGKGCTQAVVSAGLLSLKGSERRLRDVEAPAATVLAGGTHAAEVRAFLTKYYGPSVGQPLEEPAHTTTTKARFGLVQVLVAGEPYVITDIGMRMLTPRELFRAQGFGDHYVIDRGLAEDGTTIPLTKTAQIRMCGNSVCPDIARALVAANYREEDASLPIRRRSVPAASETLPLFAAE
ncbi:DNA cytosine methyltransferase [Methylobacterium gnaphalii]|uniref:DNA (cytosine-5-)-methyltransferase n=1 Tax=Methylobacterium gnaphalii TaxID=1010610 RepID=A0A512JPB6_9HYPH|nr:DNA cytosine methyltransferase [Methylobacterium gnaphalii]GEP11804.1 DNA methyltransferase [Methylobacterium gnaphalii]GJD69481.1 hypothetical protein MMMDOFMJ_2412 [Methylobacterium gnaphalii]GLS49561.1 DNA methyltransferase [Methylobacterium gnaphalii]